MILSYDFGSYILPTMIHSILVSNLVMIEDDEYF